MAMVERKRVRLIVCNEKLVIAVDADSGKIESSLGRAVLPMDLPHSLRDNLTHAPFLFPWQAASAPTTKNQAYEFGDCFVATEVDAERDILACCQYNAALDAIESLILAHAVAGMDVEAPAYIQGIETALKRAGNYLE
jgi:hypothetical protein